MSSPDLVNMMAFIRNGNPFPKSLDKNGKKGVVSSESLVGYSRYTSRENANDKEQHSMDYSPGGYYKYTSERVGATKTFTNEGWIESKKEMTQFRNYVASQFQEKDKIAWLPVQSYKDYATASQYGLFNEQDYAQITKNTLNRFFKHVGLEPTNMIWWMNYHNNKNHPHVHTVFLEKEVTRERGQFTEGELKQFKRFMLTEMKERERLILGTDTTFKNNMKLLQTNKQVLQEKSKSIIISHQDKLIDNKIQNLFKKLPDKGRLQYGSSHMIPFRKDIDKIVDLVLSHELVHEDYNSLLDEFTQLDDVYSATLNENITNMRDSEIEKIRRVIANAILSNKKITQSKLEELNLSEASDIPVEVISEQEIVIDDFEVISSEEIDIPFRDPLDAKGTFHIEWSEPYKEALSYLYGSKEVERDVNKAYRLLLSEANNRNVLAMSDLAKLQKMETSHFDENVSYATYQQALEGFHEILGNVQEQLANSTYQSNSFNDKSAQWTSSYVNYRLGKHYMYGLGTEKDYSLAIKHYSLATDNKYASYSLGTMYERGLGCDIDLEEAKSCYEKSSDKGNPYASAALARLLEKSDKEESEQLYSQALSGFKTLYSTNEDDMLLYKMAQIILDEKVENADYKQGIEYLTKSAKLGNEYSQTYLVKYYDKNHSPELTELAQNYREVLLKNKNNTFLKYEGKRLIKCDAIDDIHQGIAYLKQVHDFDKDDVLLYQLHKTYDTLEENDESTKYLELSAQQNNVFGTFKFAKMIEYQNPKLAEQYFKNSYELMKAEIHQGNNTELFKFRMAQMHENGWGVHHDRDKAFRLYKQLSSTGHQFATNKYIYMTCADKRYADYPAVQSHLKSRFLNGDMASGKYLASTYLDKDNPNYDKNEGMYYLKEVYEKTQDPDIKKSIEYYSENYEQNYGNKNLMTGAQSSISSALAAIKRSDADVKRKVKEGMDEYLETEKERERKLYGKNI